MPLRVVLVDDHRLIREGLKSYFTGRGVEVVGEGGKDSSGDNRLIIGHFHKEADCLRV